MARPQRSFSGRQPRAMLPELQAPGALLTAARWRASSLCPYSTVPQPGPRPSRFPFSPPPGLPPTPHPSPRAGASPGGRGAPTHTSRAMPPQGSPCPTHVTIHPGHGSDPSLGDLLGCRGTPTPDPPLQPHPRRSGSPVPWGSQAANTRWDRGGRGNPALRLPLAHAATDSPLLCPSGKSCAGRDFPAWQQEPCLPQGLRQAWGASAPSLPQHHRPSQAPSAGEMMGGCSRGATPKGSCFS